MTTYIARTKGYFGQAATITALKQMFDQVQSQPVCRLAYIEAPGGLGKSFLQVKLPELLGSPSALVSQPIDLSDPDTRSGNLLSNRVVEALKDDQRGVAGAFDPYQQALANYYADRGRLSAPEYERRRAELLNHLVNDLNRLAESRPLVLCMDTAEALISSAPEGWLQGLLRELNQDQIGEQRRILTNPSTINDFFDWFGAVIPNLKHALVVVCGRPVKQEKSFYGHLTSRPELAQKLQAERYDLKPLSRDELEKLLRDEWHGTGQPENKDIDEALKISDGYPLLATVYLELRRRSSRGDIAGIRDRSHFQRHLLENLLDPLAPRQPFTQQIVAYGLYALMHARRGLTAEQLKEFLRQYLGDAPLTAEEEAGLDMAVANLRFDAMVKYREESKLLLLHDEILMLLDQSRMSDTLDIRDQVQKYLVELAQTQLGAAEAQKHVPEGRSEYLRAMNNLIYYQLEKDPEEGYREHLRLTISLFNARERVLPLILRDEFWRWLSQPVSIAGTYEAAYTNRERLGRGGVRLELEDIQRDDAVWLIKYYVARGELEQAVLLGEKIKATITEAEDDYFTFDLFLTLGRAMVLRFDQEVVADASGDLLEAAVDLAFQAQTSKQPFFRGQWAYFHGVACTIAGYRWRTLFDFDRAARLYEDGRESFQLYARSPTQTMDVAEAVTQLESNLAFLQSKSGNSERAAQLMRAKINSPGFTALSLERQAISYNVASIIETERGNVRLAREHVKKAWELALMAGDRRIIAQVALQVGVARHEAMKLSHLIDHEADQYFRDAVSRFTMMDEKTSLREAELEYARYLRTCAIISKASNKIVDEQAFLELADTHLVAAFKALGADPVDKRLPTVPRAELRVERAFIYRLRDEGERARNALVEAEVTLRQLHPPPRTALTVASTICYEHGWTALRDGAPAEATRAFVAALAHARSFSPGHRSIRRFAELLTLYLPNLETETLKAMRSAADGTEPSQPLVAVEGLEQVWLQMWKESSGQVQDLLDDILYARR